MTSGTTYAGLAVCSRVSALNYTNFDQVDVSGIWTVPSAPDPPVASVNGNAVNLTWNSVSGATGYNVKRATVSGGPYTIISGSLSSTSITDTSLTYGTAYYYVVSALNTAGESPNSSQASAQLPPAAPTGLAAMGYNLEADLSWTASSGATGYNVKRSTTSGGPYTTIATGITPTVYTDTALTNGTTYYYVVTGTGLGGESANSNQASAIPVASPIVDAWLDTDIGAVGLSGSASYTSGTFTLKGAGSDIYGNVDSFEFAYQPLIGDGTIIARVIQCGGKSGVMIRESLAANARFADFILATSTRTAVFQYRTTTGGGGSNGGNGTTAVAPWWLKLSRVGNVFTCFSSPDGITWTQAGQATITMNSAVYVGLAQCSRNPATLGTAVFDNVSIVPPAPSGLNATAGDTQTSLAWSGVSSATSYNVKYALTSGGPYTTISTGITGTNCTVTGLTNGTTYYYVVSAVNLGESPNSTEVSVRPLPPLPTAPAELTAMPDNAEVDLTWSAASAATGYNVKRAVTSGGPYATIATGVTDTYFTDIGLTNGTTYYYVVSGTNIAGEGANSSQASATPVSIPGAWLDTDIGAVGLSGSASYTSGTFTLNGAGSDIFGTADSFQFAYQSLSGDGTIIARVSQCGGKSGVMIRESLAANARFVDLILATSTQTAPFQYRTTTGGGSSNGGNSTTIVAPWWLKLSRAGNVFTGYTSPDGVTWTQGGQATVTMNSAVYVGFAQCSRNPAILGTAAFDNVSIVPGVNWSSQDIGAPEIVGASYYSSGTATLIASGTDVFGMSDQFRYTYLPSSGDCDITVRVAGVQNVNAGSKGGIMIRGSLEANAQFANAFLTPSTTYGANFQYCITAGSSAAGDTAVSIQPPNWLRLTRVGDVFTAYYSPDGTAWTQLGSAHTIAMPASAYIGLILNSHTNPQVLCTGTFDNIIVNP
jgi:regulation of enolase protein 1 (concanavalin A-like superfamily)/fibronectin type 3 domain-containing protein